MLSAWAFAGAISHAIFKDSRFRSLFLFCFYHKLWGDFVGFSWLRGTLTILCFMRLHLCVDPSFRTDLTAFSELRWTSTDGECRSVRLNAFEVLEEEYTSRRFCLFFLPLLLFQYFTLCNIWKGRGDERRTWCPVFDNWTFGTAFLKVSIIFSSTVLWRVWICGPMTSSIFLLLLSAKALPMRTSTTT